MIKNIKAGLLNFGQFLGSRFFIYMGGLYKRRYGAVSGFTLSDSSNPERVDSLKLESRPPLALLRARFYRAGIGNLGRWRFTLRVNGVLHFISASWITIS